jgi:hypothetical protein
MQQRQRLSLNLAYHHHMIYKRGRLRRLQIDLSKTSQATPIINYVVGARQNWYFPRWECVIAVTETLSLTPAYHHHIIYKKSRLGRLQIDLLETSQPTPLIYHVVGARQNW